MTAQRAGILGIGVELPEQVRTNDWWPTSVVDEWRRRQPDPFMGALERRVLPEGSQVGEIEGAAARTALARAGVAAADVDVLLVANTSIASGGTEPLMHRLLGLPPHCFATTIRELAFCRQLEIAERLIDTGRARFALLIQSNRELPFLGDGLPLSAQVGMGAAAIVVGPATAARRLVGHANLLDASVADLLPAGHIERPDEESVIAVYEHYHAIVAALATRASSLLDRALAQAGLTRDDVDFWVTHQVSAWGHEALRQECGLTRATAIDTFPRTGNLMEASIGVALGQASEAGQLTRGATIALFATAPTNATAGCAILRWGE